MAAINSMIQVPGIAGGSISGSRGVFNFTRQWLIFDRRGSIFPVSFELRKISRQAKALLYQVPPRRAAISNALGTTDSNRDDIGNVINKARPRHG